MGKAEREAREHPAPAADTCPAPKEGGWCPQQGHGPGSLMLSLILLTGDPDIPAVTLSHASIHTYAQAAEAAEPSSPWCQADPTFSWRGWTSNIHAEFLSDISHGLRNELQVAGVVRDEV